MQEHKHFVHPKNTSNDPLKILALCSNTVAMQNVVNNESDVTCKKCIRLLDVLCVHCRGTGLKKISDQSNG